MYKIAIKSLQTNSASKKTRQGSSKNTKYVKGRSKKSRGQG